MSDIRITADKPMQTSTTPLPARVMPSSCFKQQLQRALAARDMPGSNSVPASNQTPESSKATTSGMTPESTMASDMTMMPDSTKAPGTHDTPMPAPAPVPTSANNAVAPPTSAELHTKLNKMMEAAGKNPFSTDFMTQNPFTLPALDGLDGSGSLNRLLSNITGSTTGDLPFQLSGSSDDGLQSGDLGRLLMAAQAYDAETNASMAQYGMLNGTSAPVSESGGMTADQIASYLADTGKDDGIFNVLMPNGQHFSVAVTVQPNTVRYLMNPATDTLRDRLKNCRMELQQTMERRIQRNVEIAVL